jgi:hypothetical protein
VTYEYRCPFSARKETFEKFFKSFSEAEKYAEFAPCPVCEAESPRVMSATLGFGLYGAPDGYYKPSPTKRFNTKLVSSIEGNSSAIG